MADIEQLQTADYFPENEPVLLGYQARWFEDESEVKIAEKSRRTGLTWAEAAGNVITASKPKRRGGRNVFYVGSRQEMALEYIAACGLFSKAFNQLAGAVSEDIFRDEDGTPTAKSQQHSTPGNIIIIERSTVDVPDIDSETKEKLIEQEKQKYQ